MKKLDNGRRNEKERERGVKAGRNRRRGERKEGKEKGPNERR